MRAKWRHTSAFRILGSITQHRKANPKTLEHATLTIQPIQHDVPTSGAARAARNTEQKRVAVCLPLEVRPTERHPAQLNGVFDLAVLSCSTWS